MVETSNGGSQKNKEMKNKKQSEDEREGVLCAVILPCHLLLKRVRWQDRTHAVVVALHVTPLLLPECWHTITLEWQSAGCLV